MPIVTRSRTREWRLVQENLIDEPENNSEPEPEGLEVPAVTANLPRHFTLVDPTLANPPPRVQVPNMAQRSRVHYRPFKGRRRDDPDTWLQEFEGTSKANGEDGIRTTIIPGLMRKEALPWFVSLPDATKTDWALFKVALQTEFRKIGGDAEALIRIGQMRMKKKESLRRFIQRFQRLLKKVRVNNNR